MKLTDILLLVAAFSFFIIGLDQALVLGMAESYWIFMFSLLPLFLYGYRKSQKESQANLKNSRPGKKKNKRTNG